LHINLAKLKINKANYKYKVTSLATINIIGNNIIITIIDCDNFSHQIVLEFKEIEILKEKNKFIEYKCT